MIVKTLPKPIHAVHLLTPLYTSVPHPSHVLITLHNLRILLSGSCCCHELLDVCPTPVDVCCHYGAVRKFICMVRNVVCL